MILEKNCSLSAPQLPIHKMVTVKLLFSHLYPVYDELMNFLGLSHILSSLTGSPLISISRSL